MSVLVGKSSKARSHLLIRYRLGGTPCVLESRGVCQDCGPLRGSSACQHPGDLPALRVACRCSLVGFDRQHLHRPTPRQEMSYSTASTTAPWPALSRPPPALALVSNRSQASPLCFPTTPRPPPCPPLTRIEPPECSSASTRDQGPRAKI